MVNNLLDYIISSATDVKAYNPVNTLLFGLLFACGVYFIYVYIIKRFGLRIDRGFLFAASMWAFFAMSIRLLYDTGKIILFIGSKLAKIYLFGSFFLNFTVTVKFIRLFLMNFVDIFFNFLNSYRIKDTNN